MSIRLNMVRIDQQSPAKKDCGKDVYTLEHGDEISWYSTGGAAELAIH